MRLEPWNLVLWMESMKEHKPWGRPMSATSLIASILWIIFRGRMNFASSQIGHHDLSNIRPYTQEIGNKQFLRCFSSSDWGYWSPKPSILNYGGREVQGHFLTLVLQVPMGGGSHLLLGDLYTKKKNPLVWLTDSQTTILTFALVTFWFVNFFCFLMK